MGGLLAPQADFASLSNRPVFWCLWFNQLGEAYWKLLNRVELECFGILNIIYSYTHRIGIEHGPTHEDTQSTARSSFGEGQGQTTKFECAN